MKKSKYQTGSIVGRLKDMGITRYNLAEGLGVSYWTLSRLLNGEREFSLEEVDIMTRLLQIEDHEIRLYFFTQKTI